MDNQFNFEEYKNEIKHEMLKEILTDLYPTLDLSKGFYIIPLQDTSEIKSELAYSDKVFIKYKE